MATGPAVTERCLLCGRELPRGGFSARVADVLLSPLCGDCERRCSREPDSVVDEHPQWFDRSEIVNPHIHPPPLTTQPPSHFQSERPTITAQPTSNPNVSGATLQQVVVTDIHMPFGSMVGFMVKWAIASIPAMIILILLAVILSFVFRTILIGMLSVLFSR
jgi:hypothetical protein